MGTFYEPINIDGLVRKPENDLSVVPTQVPRQARDPEFTEWAGMQKTVSLPEFFLTKFA